MRGGAIDARSEHTPKCPGSPRQGAADRLDLSMKGRRNPTRSVDPDGGQADGPRPRLMGIVRRHTKRLGEQAMKRCRSSKSSRRPA